jgi:hypothetical protein
VAGGKSSGLLASFNVTLGTVCRYIIVVFTSLKCDLYRFRLTPSAFDAAAHSRPASHAAKLKQPAESALHAFPPARTYE